MFVGALRLMRKIIGMKEEFYNRYIIKQNLFKHIVSAFTANGNKYNLLNSAMIELFEFIRLVSYSHSAVFKRTVKPALSGHSKIDKTKVLKTNGSLMKVKSIAECSHGAFCNTFDLH